MSSAAVDTIDGFQRYDAFPQTSWKARGLSAPKFGRPLEVRGGSSGAVRTVAWSSDGRRAAAGYEMKGLRVWQCDTRNASGPVTIESERSSIALPSGKGTSPHSGHVAALAWSPTEPDVLVSGCKSGNRGVLAVWDVSRPSAPVETFVLDGLDVMHISFHPSGDHFAVVCPGRERDEALFFTRSNADGETRWIQRGDVMINGTGVPAGVEEINSLRFSGAGNTVVAVSNDGSMNAWVYPVEERVLPSFPPAAAETDEPPAKKMRVDSARATPRPASPEAEVERAPEAEADTSRDEDEGEREEEGAGEGEKAEGGGEVGEQGEEKGGDEAADADVEMNDAATPVAATPAAEASAPASQVPTRQPSPEKASTPAEDDATAKAAAARRAEQERERRRLMQLDRVFRKLPHVGLILALAVDPRGRYFAIGGHDARLSLVDVRDWIIRRTFDAPTAPIRHVAFSHDGELVAAGGDDTHIYILGVANGSTVARIPVPGGAAINALAWQPTRTALAFSTNSKKGVVWYVVNAEDASR